ncbi:Pre-mRNA-splicing factor cwc-22 [Fasciola gigantica]|uniref:Pre-mRNA-splicing factor cwc-22 n=1 Tax=Fasciola gigantica TaxID=46835 RepID=A0A504YJ40_FASGI|nr:Pre-mRNA-splicing factor cwc-22 [Fasciola gigantica]
MESTEKPVKTDPSNIYGKTGGAYIPPARLRQMQASITDKSSEAYQRIAWEALKKSIHGFINKVNVSNISDVVRQLLSENIVRGRGLLARSLITAQTTSPTFTHVFAALVAIVNSKFPQIRRDGWKDHPIVLPDLDLIQEDDQITHTTSLLDQVDPEDNLNVFRFDPDYQANEEKYAQIKASFFESDDEDGDDADDSEGGSGDGDSSDESDGDQEDSERPQGAAAASDGLDKQTVIDQTETNLVHLRRTIYLMLQSSLSADEAGHRLLQLKIRPGEEYEVASMVLDCCAQTRSYETRYGRLAQRLCRVILTSGGGGGGGSGGSRPAAPDLGPGSRYKPGNDYTSSRSKNTVPEPEVVEDTGPPRSYVAEFEKIFGEQYAIIHRLETAKLRNVALFFAHLLYTDSISWGVLECVRLNERDTTSSGRIFLKHLFLELCSFMGLAKLNARLRDETLQPYFAGLLPRDNPKDTRFAINFLTTIGLGGLTLDLREHLQASREAALAKREARS